MKTQFLVAKGTLIGLGIFGFVVMTYSSYAWAEVPSIGRIKCSIGGRPVPCDDGPFRGSSGGKSPLGGMLGTLFQIGLDAALNELTKEPAGSTAQPDIKSAIDEAMKRELERQQERHRQLMSSMKDTPAKELLGATEDMPLLKDSLENTASSAGRIFDGTSGADDFWMSNHDPWYSTGAYGNMRQYSTTQPHPVSDQALEYTDKNFEPIKCIKAGPYGGELCPFPNMKVSIVEIDAIDVQPPEPPSNISNIISQFTESKGRLISAFRSNWSNIPSPNQKIADLITNNFVDTVHEKTLTGLQGEIAMQGRGAIKNVMRNMADHFFSQLNQSIVNPDLAIKMGEPGTLRRVFQDSMGESLPGPAKGAYLLLTGRTEDAVNTIKQYTKDRFEGFMWDTYKDTGRRVVRDSVGRYLYNNTESKTIYGHMEDSLSERFIGATTEEKSNIIPLQNIGSHPDTHRWEHHKHWLTRVME